MLAAVKESRTVEKLLYTSSFFALGPTDERGVAEENQVRFRFLFIVFGVSFFNFLILSIPIPMAGPSREIFLYGI